MAKLLKLEAAIYDSSNQFVVSLGNFIFPVLVNKWSDSRQANYEITGNYTFFNGKVDAPELLGIPNNNDVGESTAVLYMPYAYSIHIPAEYLTSGYKFVLRKPDDPTTYMIGTSGLNGTPIAMEMYVNGVYVGSTGASNEIPYRFGNYRNYDGSGRVFTNAILISQSVWDGVTPLNQVNGYLKGSYLETRVYNDNSVITTLNAAVDSPAGWTAFLKALDEYVIPTDPYADGGTSETGGGTGTFDGSTANVNLPSTTPSAGAGASGFIKLFNPSAANLAALAAYLWGTFDITSFKSIYNNPIDCIITLMVVPVTPTTGTAATISLGNVATDVTAPVVSSQFVIKDCGSININEYWGAYLDYDPYTKCEIYLPYIGIHDIDINDIQGKTIQLKYYIDVLSGACVALLLCGTDVLYHWSGQCGAEVPITSTGFGSVFQTALSAANAIGETIVNAMSGIPQSISLVASSVFNGARSKVHKSGSIGSMAGHMDIQTPYLIITRPVQSVPEKLNELQGYPSNITATLSDLEGYTEVETIYLKDIPATTAEIDEIEALLKGGVII